MNPYYVSVSRQIDASAQELFDLLADPHNHPKIDGSGSVQALRPGTPDRLYLGAEFGMDMKLGLRYRINNRVTEFVEGHIIAWKPLSGHTWRYTFTPFEGATLVTEEWDARGVWNRGIMRLTGVAKRNRAGIEQTLERIAQLYE